MQTVIARIVHKLPAVMKPEEILDLILRQFNLLHAANSSSTVCCPRGWPGIWNSAAIITNHTQIPTAAARVQTRVWSCGIWWWTKVALGQVSSENLGFPCQSTFHLLLHNHVHYHPRLAQQARSGRSANSLTNQIKKITSKLWNSTSDGAWLISPTSFTFHLVVQQ
jgi:hypothetical protein